MTAIRRTCGWLMPLLTLLPGLSAGCAGHEHAPAVVPAAAAPATTPGDRFDVVVAGGRPVSVFAVDQGTGRAPAFRYDWVGEAGQFQASGRRAAGEGKLDLPAAAGRGFLYVDAVAGSNPGAADAGGGRKPRLRWKQLGEGIWRLAFRDRGGGDADLVVTVRLGAPTSPGGAAAGPRPATTRPGTGAAQDGSVAAPSLPGGRWGARELGRPLQASPCGRCGSKDDLEFPVASYGTRYAVRCGRCNNYMMSQPTPAEAEAMWNLEQDRRRGVPSPPAEIDPE